MFKNLITAGDHICKVKGDKHTDIRPENIVWDGFNKYRLMDNVATGPSLGP